MVLPSRPKQCARSLGSGAADDQRRLDGREIMRLQLSLIFGLALAAIAPGQAAIAEVKIGFANSLTGPFSESGERSRIAVEMAVEDLNARGGVLGEQVRRGHRGRRLRLAEVRWTQRVRWSRPGCAVVIGHMLLPFVAARRRHLRDGGRPHDDPVLDPSAPDRGGPGERVPADRTGRRPGQARGRLSGRPLCPSRIAIVHDGSTYGEGLAQEARKQLHARGKTEVHLCPLHAPCERLFGRSGAAAAGADRRALRRRLRARRRV